jgi:transposase
MQATSPVETGPRGSLLTEVKRRTRRNYGAEEKIRIVLESFKREVSTADLCRREVISPAVFYGWTKAFMEGGKARLMGDSKRDASDGEVKGLRKQIEQYQKLLAEVSLENNLLKKSLVGLEGSGTSE